MAAAFDGHLGTDALLVGVEARAGKPENVIETNASARRGLYRMLIMVPAATIFCM